MLKGTFMESGLADIENNKTYVDAFLDAALKYNLKVEESFYRRHID